MWDKAKIHALLDAKPAAVTRGLLAIYALQTESEKASAATRDANGVGFSAFDAPFLTDIAERVKRGYTLSPKQMAVTRNKLKHYWRQLAAIANEQRGEGAVEPTMVAAEPEPSYRRLAPHCECENFDGERVCDWCLDPENAEARLAMLEVRDIQRAEREEAQRVAAFKMRRDDALRVADHW